MRTQFQVNGDIALMQSNFVRIKERAATYEYRFKDYPMAPGIHRIKREPGRGNFSIAVKTFAGYHPIEGLMDQEYQHLFHVANSLLCDRSVGYTEIYFRKLEDAEAIMVNSHAHS